MPHDGSDGDGGLLKEGFKLPTGYFLKIRESKSTCIVWLMSGVRSELNGRDILCILKKKLSHALPVMMSRK